METQRMDRPTGRPLPTWPKNDAEQIDRLCQTARRFAEEIAAERDKSKGLNLYPSSLIQRQQVADVGLAQSIIQAHAAKIVDRLHTMPDNLREAYRSDALKLCKAVEVMFILVQQCHGQVELFDRMMARQSEQAGAMERMQIKLTEASAEIERLRDELLNQ